MRQQPTYEIDQNGGLMGQMLMAQAIKSYRPSVWEQMKETFSRSHQYNTLAYVSELVQQAHDPENFISLDLWKDGLHPNYRPGIKWHEGLSETDSRILADRYDRDREYESIMGNTDPWSIHNIGAALGAAALDPLSYIPMVGAYSKAGQALHRGVKRVSTLTDPSVTLSFEGVMGTKSIATQRMSLVNKLSNNINPFKALINPFKPVGKYAMEGVLAESSFQIIKNMADSRQSEDIDYMSGVFDVMIAGLFGGVLGTLPMANTFRKNFRKEQLHMAYVKAMDDLKHRGEVNIDGKSPDGDKILSDAEATAKYNQDMEDITKSQEYVDPADLHPIKAHFLSLKEDLKVGLRSVVEAWKRCSS
tara:strand:+ start:7253 stop:8335 length:1083 start_codon:yes stop_codon:yes gene_type:complete